MQLGENWTLLLCYTTYSVCLWTGTESTCSLATHLHLNEYDPDCLLFVCVCLRACMCAACIDIHHSSIDYNVRVFLFLSLWNQCRLLSHKWVFPDDLFGLCPVEKMFGVFAWRSSAAWEARTGWGSDWFKTTKRPLSIKLLNTQNSLMWLQLVRRQVNRTLWAVFYGCGYEPVALFSATEHGANLWFKRMDFMPRKPSTAPQPFVLKTTEKWTHVVDLTLFEWTHERYLLDFNVKPKEWNISFWPSALEAHRMNLVEEKKVEGEINSWTGSLMDLISRHNRKWIDARDSELFFLNIFFAHPSQYREEVKL